MPPRINTPDQAPDPDGGHDLKSAFDVMITRTAALEEAIVKQTAMMKAQLDAQVRMQAPPGAGRQEGNALETALLRQTATMEEYLRSQTRMQLVGAGGEARHAAGAMAQYQPRMREDVLRRLTATGGVPADMTMGITKIGKLQATTSLQNLQAFGAQWLGEKIAGTPLYERKQGALSGGMTPLGQQVARGAAATQGEAPVPGQAAAPAAQGGGTEAAVAAAVTGAAVKSAVEAEQETEQKKPGMLRALGAQVGQAAAARITPPEAGVTLTPAEAAPPAAPGGGTGGGPGGGGPGGGPPAAGGAVPPGGGTEGAESGPAAAWRQNLGARVAMTGGTTGGILGMLRRVPILGLGIDVAQKASEIYTGQREAGRVFQETEGGQNLGAQTERLHSLAYQASMFGRVPEGVAAQMFGQVTALGYSQRAVGQGQQLQNRQRALDFIYHQYTATGADVGQSAAILETASRNATVSLKSVGDAMVSLSDVAGKAGTSAKGARDNFNDLLNTAIQVGAAGGAPQLAGAQATTQASYGQAFAKTNFTGLNAPGMQYMIAGQAGLSPAQVQQAMRTNPAAYNRLLAGSEAQFISQLPGMTPAMIADLQSMVTAAGGTATIKQQPAIVAQISTQFLNKYQIPANIDLNVWASVLSQLTGVQLTPGNVMAYVVENVGGNTMASNAGVGAAGGSEAGGQGGPGAPVAAGRTGGAAAGKYGLAQNVGGTGILGHAVGILAGILPGGGALVHTHGARSWQDVLKGGPSGPGAAETYLGAEKKSGKRSPVLEALLQNVPRGTQVAVQTASGTRVLSFEDAMKMFPNEMAAGNVQFYDSGGKNLGTTASFTQGLVDPTANVTAETASKTGAGVSISQWQKKHPQAGGAGPGGGGVAATIDLTNEAKQLLKLLPSNSDNAAAAATAPANPLPSSSSRLYASMFYQQLSGLLSDVIRQTL